jgi:hypothetical protein
LAASAFARSSLHPHIFRCLLAAVIDNVEINLSAFNEAIETDLMNGLDMYKDVAATVVKRDEAKPSIWIEPLHSPAWHGRSPLENNCL